MRIFPFFLRNYKNYIYNGSWSNIQTNLYNNCLLGAPLRVLKFNLMRSFLIYHSLLKNNLRIQSLGDGDNSEENEIRGAVQKKKMPSRVSVIINKSNEVVMDLVDAEKYAKRKKMLLVPVEGARKDRMKYKLVNSVSNVIEDKNLKGKGIKRIMFREEIAAHDLEVKINQMLKLINKGWKVVGFIETSSGGEKMNNVLNTLEKSKLKEFFVEKTKKSRAVQIVYEGKANKKEEKPE